MAEKEKTIKKVAGNFSAKPKNPNSRTLSISLEVQELGDEVALAILGKKNLSGVVSFLIKREAKSLKIEI